MGQFKMFYFYWVKFIIWFLKRAERKYQANMMKSLNMTIRMASGMSRFWFISDREKGFFYDLVGYLAIDNKAYNTALEAYDLSFSFLKGLPEAQLEVSQKINWIWNEQARLESIIEEPLTNEQTI